MSISRSHVSRTEIPRIPAERQQMAEQPCSKPHLRQPGITPGAYRPACLSTASHFPPRSWLISSGIKWQCLEPCLLWTLLPPSGFSHATSVNFSYLFPKKEVCKLSNSVTPFKLESKLMSKIKLPSFLKYCKQLKCQIHRLFCEAKHNNIKI